MAERTPRRRATAVRRGPVVAGVLGLLVAGGLADRAAGQAPPPAVPGTDLVPTAAPADALSSAFFCAGAGAPGSATAGSLVVADAGDRPERASVRLVGARGQVATTAVEVAAHASATVAEQLPGSPAAIGAVVDVDGGSAGVTQVTSGPLGWSATPCATAGSATWYLAGGATLVNARDVVSLLNPYPTDAVVDLSFGTDQGVEQPGEFQGIIVPAGGVVPVDLGTHLRRRRSIATTVRARSGRVVAAQTEVTTPPPVGAGPADPPAPVPGVATTLGAPAAGATWMWPGGQDAAGLDERWVVYDPGAAPAHVSLSVELDQGQAEPFQLDVAPHATAVVDAAGQARIPPGVGHSSLLRVTSGPGVIAVRTSSGAPGSPSPGTAALPGLPVAADAWLLPAVAAAPGTTTLDVLPTGTDPLDLTVAALAGGREVPIPGLTHLTLAPGTRAVLPVSARLPGLAGPLVVRATGPVAVEEDLGGPGGVPGTALLPAVRLAG